MPATLILATIVAIASPSALPTQNAQCARLKAIVEGPPPSGGALASMEQLVTILKAAISMTDQSCDGAEPASNRPQLYQAWKQARANCLQLTSGASSYDDLPPSSPCKEEIAP